MQPAELGIQDGVEWVDAPGPFLIGGRLLCVPMATALAYVYSDEGFVIAADGNDVLNSSGRLEIVSNHAQKIFPIFGEARQAASSFTGRITLYGDRDPDQIVFSFVKEFALAAEELRCTAAGSAGEFMSRACPILQRQLIAIRERGLLDSYPTPERASIFERGRTIVRVYLDGYFGSNPSRAAVRFFHDNQQLLWELIPHGFDPDHRNLFFGSKAIRDLLFHSEDARLSRFRNNSTRCIVQQAHDPSVATTLDEAIEAARAYIAACSEPRATQIDPQCQWLGGHLHIATITPADGFKWFIAPIGA